MAGVWRGGTQHKVSLYADDLLLFVSNPDTSMQFALSLFNHFSQFSGYKINLGKSELFPINYEAHASVTNCLPFKIEKNKFSYLGILVTKRFKDLFKENFISLLNQVKQTLAQWSPLSMSLVGRIKSIKMVILPKCMYLFQALPVFNPRSFIDQLDSVISSYIWRGKRPRLNKSHLQKAKAAGGLAFPNLRFYYWAANLCCLAFWSAQLP